MKHFESRCEPFNERFYFFDASVASSALLWSFAALLCLSRQFSKRQSRLLVSFAGFSGLLKESHTQTVLDDTLSAIRKHMTMHLHDVTQAKTRERTQARVSPPEPEADL